MKPLIQLFLFTNLIILSFSIVPFWNLKKSSIDLLPAENSYEENMMKDIESHFNLRYIFRRNLQKINGTPTLTNIFTCQFTNDPYNNLVVNHNVDFEEIESAYTDVSGRYYICPKGRNHPLYEFKTENKIMEPRIPDGFVDEGDWELKCFMQYQRGCVASSCWKKIFVFYLNKEEYIYQIDANTNTITKVGNEKYNIIDFRWTTDGSNDVYTMYAITAKDKQTRIEQFDFYVTGSTTSLSENGYNNLFNFPKNNFMGNLNDDKSNSKFYYIAYEKGSIDIMSGYTDNLSKISNINYFNVNHNTESPLKFVDKVRLEYIKFISYTQYAYYKLYNEDKDKYYYGIIDIEINKVIYNTDELLLNYTTYSKNSMLAVTSESAYKICAICINNECQDSCDNTIFYDTENVNTCENSYKCNAYTLIPDQICIGSCDTNIFYDNGQNECGLCKDSGIDKPFKMINYSGCLKEKVENSYYINEEFKIITCNDNYSFYDGECRLSDCYETCATCTEKSTNFTEQKCLSCKNEYPILYQSNCLNECPNNTYQDDNTCKLCASICKTCDKNGCTSCSPGYYLNTETHSCETCHEKCETCSSGGTDENNNCIICKSKNDMYENGNCISICKEREYKTNRNKCESCLSTCASCVDGDSCEDCLESYYLSLNDKKCHLCYDNCYNCTEGGNDTKHNCLSCKNNNYYLVKGGIYENNCVETCPENTIKDDNYKICTFSNITSEDDNLTDNSNLIAWIFIIAAGVLLIIFNIIFFGKNCCFKGKQDISNSIQTELSDMNLIVN